jgi:hypothetical protein
MMMMILMEDWQLLHFQEEKRVVLLLLLMKKMRKYQFNQKRFIGGDPLFEALVSGEKTCLCLMHSEY